MPVPLPRVPSRPRPRSGSLGADTFLRQCSGRRHGLQWPRGRWGQRSAGQSPRQGGSGSSRLRALQRFIPELPKRSLRVSSVFQATTCLRILRCPLGPRAQNHHHHRGAAPLRSPSLPLTDLLFQPRTQLLSTGLAGEATVHQVLSHNSGFCLSVELRVNSGDP